MKFQSTHPLRGATYLSRDGAFFVRISIHAPLAGCDRTRAFWGRESAIFQSTHPLRGATHFYGKTLAEAKHFNPRTPCGVRRRRRRAYRDLWPISIHAPLAGCDSKNVQRKLHFFELADKLSARIAAKKPSAKADRCA